MFTSNSLGEIIGYVGAALQFTGISSQVHKSLTDKGAAQALSPVRMISDIVTNALTFVYGITLHNRPICVASSSVVVGNIALAIIQCQKKQDSAPVSQIGDTV